MPLLQSVSKDIKTLSFIDGNIWQDRAYAGILLSLSSALWLDLIVLLLGRAAVTALVIGIIIHMPALLVA